jgi:hypothetical protein
MRKMCRLAALLLCAGALATLWGLDARAAATDSEDSPAQGAQIVADRMMSAIQEGDYDKFTVKFAPALKSSMTRTAFLALQKEISSKLGKLKNIEYIGSLKQGGRMVALYKAAYTKERDDVLLRIVFEKGSDELTVSGLWFDWPEQQ